MSLTGSRTLLEEAELAGYATGIVSTARITHATPAATYAHVPNRNWEADSMLPAAASAAGCTDIAAQLVDFEPGDGLDVVLGGGRAAFRPAEAPDPEYPETRGMRADQVNQELVTAMIKLARTMHFRIVAEEVEHQEDFDWLRSVGVDFVQGHFVEPPMPLGTGSTGNYRILNP